MGWEPRLQMGTAGETLARRAGAFLIDVTLWLQVGGSIGLNDLSIYLGEGGRVSIQYGGVFFLFYLTVAHAVSAQTVGKGLLGIAVADRDGGPCSFKQAGYRSLLLLLDLALGGLVALLSILDSETNQRVGDRVAGTVVVRAHR